MHITFLGAAESVTGSRFLVESQGQQILIDCGLFQERDLRVRNWETFPAAPDKISSVLLTHAHIDHCGYLPKLVREGFAGRIYCTAPTADIAKVGLLDSAKVQESDAAYKRKRHAKEGRKGKYPEVPLYTIDDARNVFDLFAPVAFGRAFDVTDTIRATYYAAGHILGAAMIELKVTEDGKTKTVIFSGDIGRWNRPLLCDPHLFARADAVIMEATYGNRLHDAEDCSLDRLCDVINATRQRGGNIVIPTFAIERTQELLYDLNRLLKDRRIPSIPVFVDSPMAIEVTKIFENYTAYFDQDARDLMARHEELFDFPMLKLSATTDDSKAINHLKKSAIIMAGSGMCTGGRVKHHLANNISRPESTILFVGYQAVGTLGRIILEKPEEVRIFGQNYPVRAQIEKINGFSAHADRDELLKWVNGFKSTPSKIFIVHSEKNVAGDFVSMLNEKLSADVAVAQYQQTVSV